MARVYPFRPFHYGLSAQGDLCSLIAPPYDVLSEDGVRLLREKNDSNIVHVTLPRSEEGEDKYVSAGKLFDSWIEREILVRRSEDAIYPYSQTFTHPESGIEIVRLGIVLLVGLEEFSSGIVFPHESTHAKPKEERLRLMEETHGNVEMIFGMYPDKTSYSKTWLSRQIDLTEPFISVVDSAGCAHKVWEVSESEEIDQFHKAMADVSVTIVDGHHRYETALTYAKENEATLGTEVNNGSSIMAFLTPLSDDGLLILPTHRAVHSLEGFSLTKLLSDLSSHFEVVELKDVDTYFESFDSISSSGPGTFIMISNGRHFVLRYHLESESPDSDANRLGSLDVSILHDVILEEVIGISPRDVTEQKSVSYCKSKEDIEAVLSNVATQILFLVRPPTVEDVVAVAESGSVMPQKSTYFYPKLASGLLFNKFS